MAKFCERCSCTIRNQSYGLFCSEQCKILYNEESYQYYRVFYTLKSYETYTHYRAENDDIAIRIMQELEPLATNIKLQKILSPYDPLPKNFNSKINN
jgi:hypothetical protein